MTTTLSTTQTNTFGSNGQIETVTVGTSGYYDITADGAQGGSGAGGNAGGLGVMARPASRIDHCQTPVRNRMLPSSMAKKPMA